MMISIHSVLSFIYGYIRPMLKWFLRQTTKLCELQRICYGQIIGAPRTLAVEASLLQSKNPALKALIYFHENRGSLPHQHALQCATETVIQCKKIDPQIHVQFVKSFAKCMEQIWSYISLVKKIEELRQTQYDFQNKVHEEKLLRLWDLLVPDKKLDSRVTKQWQFIGFQGCVEKLKTSFPDVPPALTAAGIVGGKRIELKVLEYSSELIWFSGMEAGDDPKTDFRGMGILGLENLLFFATEYNSIAQRILLKSQHPKHGYAFAIVGINLTHLTYHLVKDGTAKTHVYNATRSPVSIRTFHQLYSYLYIEFDNFWTTSKPNNIMDFSFIRDKFEKNIRESLSNPLTLFKVNVVVDDV